MKTTTAIPPPHFMHPGLLDWAFDENILALVEPIVGPDIALFSTHFICKPKGNGVDTATSVFGNVIKANQRDDERQVYIELQPNECSIHDSRIMHGSESNTPQIRRCGWTLRFAGSACKFNNERFAGAHQVYLVKGRDLGGNIYADPTRTYPEVMEKRGGSSRYKNSH